MEKTNIARIIKYAGAYIAFIIGSGFATGQEIIQFYTSYGIYSIGGIFISMFLFAWVGNRVMTHSFDEQNVDGPKPYQRYCGKYLGTFYEYFVVFFLFCVVVIMISGAGATLNEYYGLNYYVGSILMAMLIYGAYVFGLKDLVNIIGCIGPVIIVFTIIVGIITIANNGLDFASVGISVKAIEKSQASPHWIISGMLYAAYNVFGAIIFLNALGKEAKTRKEASWGGAVGGITLMIATLVMNIAFLTNLDEISALAIPSLHLADKISPVVGAIFSIVLLCGIFSTAAPMAWTVCDKIVPSGSKNGKIRVACIVALACLCGQLPFGTLVGTIYPYTGYLGILLMICIAVSEVRMHIAKKKELAYL